MRRLPVGGVGLRDLKQVIGVVDVLPILARALVAVRNAPDSLSRSGSARACENVGPPLRCFDCWEKPSEKTCSDRQKVQLAPYELLDCAAYPCVDRGKLSCRNPRQVACPQPISTHPQPVQLSKFGQRQNSADIPALSAVSLEMALCCRQTGLLQASLVKRCVAPDNFKVTNIGHYGPTVMIKGSGFSLYEGFISSKRTSSFHSDSVEESIVSQIMQSARKIWPFLA